MLCTDLTPPVMIVLSVMALTLGFPAENIHKNRLSVTVDIRDSQPPKEYPSCPICKSMNTWQKNKTRRYLEPIIIKLENVYEKYEDKKKEMEKIYPGFSQLTLPKKKKLRSFGCLNLKQLKRNVSKLIKKVQKISKNLKYLIYLEKQLSLKKSESHESRLKLLKEFRAEIKNFPVSDDSSLTASESKSKKTKKGVVDRTSD